MSFRTTLFLFLRNFLLVLCLVSRRPVSSFVSNSNRQVRQNSVVAPDGSLVVVFSSKRSSNEKKDYDVTKNDSAKRTNTKKKKKSLNPSEEIVVEREQQEQPTTLVETIGGGSATIFEMARRMLVWNDDVWTTNSSDEAKNDGILPRWHPHAGISDVNPSFRTKAPAMNNKGYAGQIWRNVRKRNKPSLWRHALRIYDRMEEQASSSRTTNNNSTNSGATTTSSSLKIERSTIHHEGALLACAKLGLWSKSLEIFEQVDTVTDNMVLSIVKACVRASKKLKREKDATLEERKVPLDAAVKILEDVRVS